jgi:hypothetical protein
VNRRAAIVILGTMRNRSSSVTVPTRTMVLSPSLLALWVCLTIREIDRGGRLVLDWKSRLRTTLLNLESVRRARKR